MPFAIYAVIAVGAFSIFGKSNVTGIVSGVLMGGVLYLGITVLMVKFGWNPPVWGAAAKAEQAKARTAKSTGTAKSPSEAPAGPRPKPSATSRTNAGNPRARRGR